METQEKEINYKNEIFEDLKWISQEDAKFIYELLQQKRSPDIRKIIEFADSEGRCKNYDTATPEPYMNRISEIFPNIRMGNYIFDYTDRNIYGELINVNDLIAKRVYNFIYK